MHGKSAMGLSSSFAILFEMGFFLRRHLAQTEKKRCEKRCDCANVAGPAFFFEAENVKG